MSLISFIIPVYNGENYIKRCLLSILNQKSSIEIIIINDGSTDQSISIMQSTYKSYNPNNHELRIITTSNKGVANARNLGIRLAKSPYIAFVDQDDFITADFCSIFVPYINEDSYDIIISGFYRKNEKNIITRKFLPLNYPWTKYCLIYPWGRVYKRDFLLNNNINFLKTSIGEDVYFNMVAYSKTNNICILSKYSYIWFDNPHSVSNKQYTTINKVINPIYTFDKILSDKRTPSYSSFEFEEYFFIKFIVWYLLSNSKKSERSNLIQMRNKLFSWLQIHYPNFRKNKYCCLVFPKGDLLFNSIIVKLYMVAFRLHADKLLLLLINWFFHH